MSYSQNSEESIILDFFKNEIGTFLDLGSFTGIELSNVRALAERGWSGVMVEPSPTIFQQLIKNYCGFTKIDCYNLAVGLETKIATLFDNHNAVATMYEEETRRWGNTQEFKKINVPLFHIHEFLETLRYKTFDFISCDIEGGDLEILENLDLFALKTKMVCVEWNSKNFEKYDKVIKKFAFKLVHQNAENLIYTI